MLSVPTPLTRLFAFGASVPASADKSILWGPETPMAHFGSFQCVLFTVGLENSWSPPHFIRWTLGVFHSYYFHLAASFEDRLLWNGSPPPFWLPFQCLTTCLPASFWISSLLFLGPKPFLQKQSKYIALGGRKGGST